MLKNSRIIEKLYFNNEERFLIINSFFDNSINIYDIKKDKFIFKNSIKFNNPDLLSSYNFKFIKNINSKEEYLDDFISKILTLNNYEFNNINNFIYTKKEIYLIKNFIKYLDKHTLQFNKHFNNQELLNLIDIIEKNLLLNNIEFIKDTDETFYLFKNNKKIEKFNLIELYSIYSHLKVIRSNKIKIIDPITLNSTKYFNRIDNIFDKINLESIKKYIKNKKCIFLAKDEKSYYLIESFNHNFNIKPIKVYSSKYYSITVPVRIDKILINNNKLLEITFDSINSECVSYNKFLEYALKQNKYNQFILIENNFNSEYKYNLNILDLKNKNLILEKDYSTNKSDDLYTLEKLLRTLQRKTDSLEITEFLKNNINLKNTLFKILDYFLKQNLDIFENNKINKLYNYLITSLRRKNFTNKKTKIL